MELLTTIAILAVMVALLFKVFRTTSDVVVRNDSATEVNQVVRAVLDQIARDLERAVYVEGVVNMYQPTGGTWLGGAIPTNSLYFLSDLGVPEPNPYGSFVNVGYRIAPANVGGVASKMVLMRGDDPVVCTSEDPTNCPPCCADAASNWWSYFSPNNDPNDPGYNPAYWKVLSENIVGIEFHYFTNATANSADDFTTTWDNISVPNPLPISVQVVLYTIDSAAYNRALRVDPNLTGTGQAIMRDNLRTNRARIFLPRSTANP